MSPKLQVVLDREISPPTGAHSLLTCFQFGKSADYPEHPAVVRTNLSPIDHDVLFECWWTTGKVRFESYGSIRVAECEDFAVFTYKCDDESGYETHSEFTLGAYRELLNAVRRSSHPRIAKIWNYLGGINDGEGDMERYRQFSVGRTLAFREFGLTDEIAPTGTGIGTLRKQGLTMVALSSHADVRLSENPRQISAFNYPRQYGPHSPKFGRGGSVTTRDVNVYLISGTASIIGHESVHISDTIAQFEETMRNLDAVYDAISRSNKDQPNIVLDHRSALRVYLRNPDDYTTISDRLRNRLGPDADQIAYLHAHICRKELTLEIDGVCAQ